MDARLTAAWRHLPEYLAWHVALSASALVLGLALAVPLAVLAVRNRAVRAAALTAAGVIQTIPSLALLALFFPMLVALSALTRQVAGFTVPALGFLPALLALTLYSVLPILRNAVAGLEGVPQGLRDAARALGFTPLQSLMLVEAPVAAPVFMAGVRTAAVWTVGTATLATPVGQTSLGNYIFTGLQTEDWVSVLFGCAAAAVVALAADGLLLVVEGGARAANGRRMLLGLGGLGVAVAAALAPLALTNAGGASARAAYVVGAKNFGEQFILAELMAKRIEQGGARAATREGLGSAVAFRALAGSEIDVYVDYSGTLWTNVLHRSDQPGRAAMLRVLTTELKRRFGVTLLGPLGFENAYALAMTRARSDKLKVRSIADLARAAPGLTLGADVEFLARPEWRVIRDAYALNFHTARSYQPTFMYRALDSGDVDVISAFSSDGRIAADRLVVLSDPRRAIPPYDAVILIAPARAHDARLRAALEPLVGAIGVDAMRKANYAVDGERRTPGEAAAGLVRSLRRGP